MKDYDPAGDQKQREEDARDDEVLETTADLAAAQRIFDKRYNATTGFQQAQRGFDKHIDEDCLRTVAARSEQQAG